MKKAFIAGAQQTVPGIRALAIITGDYDNASKGREAASILIGNGADVIWHAADVTGLGAIQGAVAGKCKSARLLFRPDRSGPEQHGHELRDESRRNGDQRFAGSGGQAHSRAAPNGGLPSIRCGCRNAARTATIIRAWYQRNSGALSRKCGATSHRTRSMSTRSSWP